MSEKIIGMIIPIPSYLLKRIFDQGKNIIVKVATVFKEIRPGSKVLFYSSHEIHAVVGEGTVERSEIVSASELLNNFKKYDNRMFITEKELRTYVSQRKKGRFLVITLKDIKKYNTPVKLKRFVPMAGQYLTQHLYEEILSKQR